MPSWRRVQFPDRDSDQQHWKKPVSFYLQVVFYDRYEKEMVSQVCNSSLCTLVQFQFSLWPDHVRDLKLQAYRYLVCTVPTSNSSLCTLVQFQFSLWPDHVRDLKLQAYRYSRRKKKGISRAKSIYSAALTSPISGNKKIDKKIIFENSPEVNDERRGY